MFFIMDIKYRFTSGEWKLFQNVAKLQSILSRLVAEHLIKRLTQIAFITIFRFVYIELYYLNQ